MANIDVFLSKIIPIVLCGAPRDMLSGIGVGDVTVTITTSVLVFVETK